MSIVTLLPFIVLIGAMFLMTRSAKRKQQQATQMRDQMQPGSGVRTIGGMYATVKEVHAETVLLEVDAGTHAIFAKNAIGAVLDDEEYNRIVHGAAEDVLDLDVPSVPDDASSLTEFDAPPESASPSDDSPIDLSKRDPADHLVETDEPDEPVEATADTRADDAADETDDEADDAPAATKAALVDAAGVEDAAGDAQQKKADGESDAK